MGESIMGDEELPQKPKRIVEKSVKNPYYSLKECIVFIEMIKNIGGRKEAPISSILKEMNVADVSNKRYSYSVSSAEQFGLIEKTDGGWKVTDKVMVILFPTEGETQKTEALKECFKRPNLYTLIINQYDGLVLPEKDTLKNIFLHYGIVEKVVDQAVESFIESARYANVLRDNKLLVTSAKVEKTESSSQKEITPQNLEQPALVKESNFDSYVKDEYHKLELVISNGKKAIVVIPKESKKEDIEKLQKLLGVFISE